MSNLPVPGDPTPSPANILSYSKQLALKLRDPVNNGSEDGKIFLAEHRYGYLTRAIGKLLRNLSNINFDIEKIYPQLFLIIDRWFNFDGDLTDVTNAIEETVNNLTISLQTLYDVPIFEIFKIYGKKKDGTISRGNFVRNTIAFDLWMGVSTTDYNLKQDRDFFYTIINNELLLIANPDLKVTDFHFLIKNPIREYNAVSQDLVIPVEYNDLYLSIAALEGAVDIGDANKVTLYKNEINGELQLLVAGVKNDKTKEITDATSR